MDNFEHYIEERGSEIRVFFSGFLNENADFSGLGDLSGSVFFLNMSEVQGTNSLGLKKWITWIAPLAKETQIVLEKCPPPVVQQMSILRGFVPSGAQVKSIYVPYYCENCGNEESLLHENGTGFFSGTADTEPGYRLKESHNCGKCGSVMEPDILPESYFKFLFIK